MKIQVERSERQTKERGHWRFPDDLPLNTLPHSSRKALRETPELCKAHLPRNNCKPFPFCLRILLFTDTKIGFRAARVRSGNQPEQRKDWPPFFLMPSFRAGQYASCKSTRTQHKPSRAVHASPPTRVGSFMQAMRRGRSANEQTGAATGEGV